VRVADRQVLALRPDAGAVLVGNARPGEFDVLDSNAVAPDHPDAHAVLLVAARRVRNQAVGPHVRSAADAPKREIVLTPDDDIVDVYAGVDLDDVAAARGARR